MELIDWKHTKAVLEQYAEALAPLYKANLEKNGRKATGELLQSISTEVDADGISISVFVNLAEYWKYVEWDTKPHFAPIEPLFNWVQAKPLLPRPGEIKRHRDGVPYTQEEMQLGIAYAVRHKIANEGTKGSHDLKDTIAALNDEYRERILAAVQEDVNATAEVIIQSFSTWDK